MNKNVKLPLTIDEKAKEQSKILINLVKAMIPDSDVKTLSEMSLTEIYNKITEVSGKREDLTEQEKVYFDLLMNILAEISLGKEKL